MNSRQVVDKVVAVGSLVERAAHEAQLSAFVSRFRAMEFGTALVKCCPGLSTARGLIRSVSSFLERTDHSLIPHWTGGLNGQIGWAWIG